MKKGVTFNRNPLLGQPLPAWRSRMLLLMMLTGFAMLIGRSLYLQGVENEFLQAEGESRYQRVIPVQATRGRIMDRHGEMLAVSTPVKSVAAIPEAAKLTPQQARQLAGLLELDVRELQHKLATEKNYCYLKRQIAPDVAGQVASLKLPGVRVEDAYRRYYPGGDVTAHMLGFTGVDDKGQEGIELAFENQLAGKLGSRRVIQDRRGQIVEDVESIRAPQEGRDITLALDSKIQYLAYTSLREALEVNKAKAGSIVAIDAKTGEVLALVNLPTYNPNNRVKLAGAQLRNRALTDSYEPGSTLKPFTAAMALETGKYQFDTPIQTSPGRLTIGTATISDAHAHGLLTLAQVIQKSSNVGAAKVALSFPAKQMWQMFDDLGYGAPLKLGFPGEVGGRLRPASTWRPIEQATMSYGHGISVSLMQMAHAYLAFARDGDLLSLSLTRMDSPPLKGKQVFSAQTAREVRAMLEMAVQPGGTAPKAQIPGYRVAGKTGTAHKVEGNGYAARRYVSSFVGFAPASDPRLVVAVMIDEPAGLSYYGGDVAAPVFAKVMAGSMRALGVAPDAPLAPLQVAKDSETVKESM